jgi:CBS domain-containing protein
VAVDPGDTLGDILRLLAKHNILSAPIIERATGKFSGFVDVSEILGLFVSRARRWLAREHGTSYGHEKPSLPQNRANETVGVYSGALREEMYAAADEAALLEELHSTMGAGMFTRTLRAARSEFPDAPEGDGEAIFRGYLQASLLAVVSAAFMHPVEPRLRLFAATGALATNHRVGVYDWDPAFDDGSRVTDPSRFEIISQSDIVRFLWDRREDENLVELFGLGVSDAGLLVRRTKNPREVRCVYAGDTKAIDAFAIMHRENVSALGICSRESAALLGNVSASDFRGVTPENVSALASDVYDFVAGKRKELVTCFAASAVRDVIERMVTKRVHHVYVCDDASRPIAMITSNDILRVVADVLVEG